MPKPNVSGREGISSRCHRFDLLPFLHVCGDQPWRQFALCSLSSSDGKRRSTVTGRWFIQFNSRAGYSAFAIVYGCFLRIKMLGRTEARTRDRMYCQTMRTVWDISRDDRAIIATCSLQTPTNRLKETYTVAIPNFPIGCNRLQSIATDRDAWCVSKFWS